MDIPSTPQIIDFVSVIDCGGLSAAARSLGKAQAAVSYSIQSLERELGVMLFDRNSRPLMPTADGLAIAAVARDVIQDIGRLQMKAASLKQGIERRLTVVLDALMPMKPLLPVIRDFATVFPGVQLEVTVDAMASPASAVLNGSSTMGISSSAALRYQQLLSVPLLTIQRIAVAAYSHPLAAIDRPITLEVIRQHRQITMLDREPDRSDRAYVSVSNECWRTSDLGAKREMLLAGLGWGNMPQHVVEDDLTSGRLLQLDFTDAVEARWSTPLQLYLIRAENRLMGPAATWLYRSISLV